MPIVAIYRIARNSSTSFSVLPLYRLFSLSFSAVSINFSYIAYCLYRKRTLVGMLRSLHIVKRRTIALLATEYFDESAAIIRSYRYRPNRAQRDLYHVLTP